MRFMMIYKPADRTGMEAGVPPTQDEMTRMGEFISELAHSGVLLATDGLQASAKGARVRRSGGKVTVVDGPFGGAKELIGGFAIQPDGRMSVTIAVTGLRAGSVWARGLLAGGSRSPERE